MEPSADERRERSVRSGGSLASKLLVIIGVVIVGLGSLVSLYYVVFFIAWSRPADLREKLRQDSCHENLKHLSLALLAYSADYDGRLPEPEQWPTAALTHLDPKLDRQGIGREYTCPSQEHAPQVTGIPWERGQGLSYAMSLGLPRGDPRRAPKASEIPMLFDSDLVPVARPSQAAARHGPPGRDSLKQANFAYLDGHVKSVPSDYFGVPPGGKPRAPTGVRKDGR